MVAQWGINDDCVSEEKALGLMDLHWEAWEYAVANEIALDFRPAFYEFLPFDNMMSVGAIDGVCR